MSRFVYPVFQRLPRTHGEILNQAEPLGSADHRKAHRADDSSPQGQMPHLGSGSPAPLRHQKPLTPVVVEVRPDSEIAQLLA